MSDICHNGHDLADGDTAIADGLCPLCLQSELAAAQARIKEMTEIGIEIQNERLAIYENLGKCDECGTPYAYDATDNGSICVPCVKTKLLETLDKLAKYEQATMPEEPAITEMDGGREEFVSVDDYYNLRDLAAAQKDAERYRWLRAHSWIDTSIIKSVLNFGPGYQQTKPECLDAAIDAAIAAEGRAK